MFHPRRLSLSPPQFTIQAVGAWPTRSPAIPCQAVREFQAQAPVGFVGSNTIWPFSYFSDASSTNFNPESISNPMNSL
jgi:hypothetical protein